MTREDMTRVRPDELHTNEREGPTTLAERQARLETLFARWDQFAAEFSAARGRRDQEVMTNLRGLMLLIKREITRLGGASPQFPHAGDHHLADV